MDSGNSFNGDIKVDVKRRLSDEEMKRFYPRSNTRHIFFVLLLATFSILYTVSVISSSDLLKSDICGTIYLMSIYINILLIIFSSACFIYVMGIKIDYNIGLWNRLFISMILLSLIFWSGDNFNYMFNECSSLMEKDYNLFYILSVLYYFIFIFTSIICIIVSCAGSFYNISQ